MVRWHGRPSEPVRLTPRPVLEALGGAHSFDLDPCAAPEPRPWPTAVRMIGKAEADGLAIRWHGRVWLNPPYSAWAIKRWLARMAEHGHGTALINATTETGAWARHVWGSASGLLFLEGRLFFCDQTGDVILGPNGRPNNNPAPSVLCAYGQDDLDRLAASGLAGHLVPLRFARFALVAALDPSWTEIVGPWLRAQHGPVSVSDAYRHFARHPKARGKRHWQAKVRQKLQELGERVAPATYRARLV